MAINPESRYPGQIGPGTTDYPYGEAEDVSSPGAGDGTPLKADWLKDWWGFAQRLLKNLGQDPSNIPETVPNSQYFNSLVALAQGLPNRVQLESQIASPTTHLTAKPGVAWNLNRTRILRNPSNFTKDVSNTWEPGSGNGGRPAAVSIPTDGSLHYFQLQTAGEVVDFGWDSSINATNLLAAAAGDDFIDAARLGSSIFRSGLIVPIIQIGDEFHFRQSAAVNIINTGTPSSTLVNVSTPTPADVITLCRVRGLTQLALNNSTTIELRSNVTTQLSNLLSYRSSVAGAQMVGSMDILASTTAQIQYRYLSDAPSLLILDANSYVEFFDQKPLLV